MSIITREPADDTYRKQLRECERMLNDARCTVSVRKGNMTSLAIVDQETIWYGSIPLLGFAKSDECSLRFESAEVAFELEQSAAAFTILP